MSRARGWCYTANNYTDVLEEQLQSYTSVFHVYTREVGDSGTPHLQGYIEFKSAKQLSTLHKRFNTLHWEQRRGTKWEAYNYCIKTGPPTFLHGDIPVEETTKKDPYKELRTRITQGATKRDIIESGANIRDLDYLDRVRDVLEPQRDTKPTVHWFCGPSGTGKTTTALNECSDYDFYCVPSNPKWWPGYDRHTHVIIDELRDQYTISQLLRLLDFLPLKVEIKGGHVTMTAEHIYITTLYTPEDFMHKYYCGEEDTQLIRRIDDLRHFAKD